MSMSAFSGPAAGGVIPIQPEAEVPRDTPNTVLGVAPLQMHVVGYADDQGVVHTVLAVRWPTANSKYIWRVAPNSEEWLAGTQPMTNKKVHDELERQFQAQRAKAEKISTTDISPTTLLGVD